MHARPDDAGPFTRFGPVIPASPLVVSVPHAGRDYPPELIAASLLPVEALAALEDRLVDRLVAGLPALGVTGLVARRPRAWIDLNRDEREMDPAMIAPPPRPGRFLPSAKVRGGIGLIPRRVAGMGDILAGRMREDQVEARLAADHRPWHAAIDQALAAARARFGIALLIDLHSMPPLVAAPGTQAPHIVIGDRHGRSCARAFVDRLRETASVPHIAVALNDPYAGGHTIERHGNPARDIHAVQIELDRSLYLAPDLRTLGPGLEDARRLVTRLAQAMLALLDERRLDAGSLAAE